MEDYDTCFKLATFAESVCKKHDLTYIFKALSKNFHVTTDIHTPDQANEIAEFVDIIQIPSFLSRQTDLLVEAGHTNKIINVKKFQLLSGQDMVRPIEKILSTKNDKIMLTERGTMVPYGNVIVDLRNLIDMVNLGYPVVMDCTHSCQSLDVGQTCTNGRKEMASIYAQAATICGVSGHFAEIYEQPERALCDSTTSLSFNEFETLISDISNLLK